MKRYDVLANDGSLISEGCNNVEQAKKEGEESGVEWFVVVEADQRSESTATRTVEVYDSRSGG
jgi:hypothetical protein